MPPEHQSQNGMFYTKIAPIIGPGYLKMDAVANIVFAEKCLMISQVYIRNDFFFQLQVSLHLEESKTEQTCKYQTCGQLLEFCEKRIRQIVK